MRAFPSPQDIGGAPELLGFRVWSGARGHFEAPRRILLPHGSAAVWPDSDLQWL